MLSKNTEDVKASFWPHIKDPSSFSIFWACTALLRAFLKNIKHNEGTCINAVTLHALLRPFVNSPTYLFSVLILMDRIVERQCALEKIICFRCKWKKKMHALRETLQSVCGHPVWLLSLLTVYSNWEDKVRNRCDMFFNIYVDKHYSHVKPW